MIFTKPTEVIKEAGYTPENFYLHPCYHSPASYVPIWHHLKARPWTEPAEENESDYKITETLK